MEKNVIIKNVLSTMENILEGQKSLPQTLDEDISVILDSIQFVSLIIELENQYELEINDDDFEMDKINTVNKISELILSYQN